MAKIVIVGPHPDDQELGMGGTAALLADQGHDVLLLDMTDGEPTPRGDRSTRLNEAEAARLALSPALRHADVREGLPAHVPGVASGSHAVSSPPAPSLPRPIRRLLLDLPNRRVEHTLANRHMVAGVIRAHQASMVFLPYFEDAHPDHLAVTRIVEDARFDAKLTKFEPTMPPGVMAQIDSGATALNHIGPPIYPKWMIYYYATHLRIVPQPSFIMDVTTTLERKMAAIAAYRSQFEANEKNQPVVEWVKSQARYYGSRIGVSAGEPFFMREPLGLGSVTGLV
jgi:N-acetylglucosamine malate deacetylase 1